MHTLLNRFCEEFVRLVRPIQDPIADSTDAINAAPDDNPAKVICGELMDLRNQFELLADKVAEQQAYVLIFGPLKSGKSTLMNGICASYVSEVSSLPAYPCMVFVSHSQVREYLVTDYTGKTRTFTEPGSLQRHIDQAHRDLAARIRKHEQQHDDFDPQLHFPEAIRRVDVKVPAGDLAQSSAVLVDTPGLYSRMKFGYDRMTRDFRNAAACAVFVVRSDNLFLEQVFAEFTQLLELFSRIFLVVNLDTAKQDLSPNGNLVPSLENKDPGKLIEAFENLTMSATLKTAAEEGRLRIYPIGLLQAASERLQQNQGDDRSERELSEQGKDFNLFLADLTEYLNSTDYLLAFLGDSLRRAGSLLKESIKLCQHPRITELQSKMVELKQERDREQEQLKALRTLKAFDWIMGFKKLQKQLTTAVEKQASEVGNGASLKIEQELNKWFKHKSSLQDLVKGELSEIYSRYQEDLIAAVGREISDQIVRAPAGIDLSEEIVSAALNTRIDLDAIGRKAHHRTDRNSLIAQPPTPIRSEHIPVHKTFWDWLLFRSKSGVRTRLFGPTERPTQPISKEQKSIRLGDGAKTAIKRCLGVYEKEFFSQSNERMRKGFIGGYCRAAINAIRNEIKQRQQAVETKIVELEASIEGSAAIIEPIAELLTQGRTALKAVEKLSEHYTELDLFMLTQPSEQSYVLPSRKAPSQEASVQEALSPGDREPDQEFEAAETDPALEVGDHSGADQKGK